MHTLAIYLAALVLGVIAGLRTFTPIAAVSWAAALGELSLRDSHLAFLGSRMTAWVFTALAIFELFADQVPSMASRKTPMQFAVRVASGALCGTAVATTRGSWLLGLILGVVGAIIGTLGGYDFRMRLARSFRRDRPAAFIEDAVAIAAAVLVVAVLA